MGTNCATIDICPDILIGGIFAAGAAALGLLYTLITMVGRRRKKRGIKDNIIENFDDNEMFKIMFEDVVLTGMDKKPDMFMRSLMIILLARFFLGVNGAWHMGGLDLLNA